MFDFMNTQLFGIAVSFVLVIGFFIGLSIRRANKEYKNSIKPTYRITHGLGETIVKRDHYEPIPCGCSRGAKYTTVGYRLFRGTGDLREAYVCSRCKGIVFVTLVTK